jgi:hypothetical protein
VLEVDAYASVQDLIHAAILANKGAASLKEVGGMPALQSLAWLQGGPAGVANPNAWILCCAVLLPCTCAYSAVLLISFCQNALQALFRLGQPASQPAGQP